MILPHLEKLELKNLLILCTTTSLLIGVFLGTGGTLLWKKTPNNFKEVRSTGGYSFISPLLECENVELEYSSDITELRADIVNKIEYNLKVTCSRNNAQRL